MAHEIYPLGTDMLLASSDQNGDGTGVTEVLSLPSLKPLWTQRNTELGELQAALMDAQTGTLVLSGETLRGVSARTGRTLWDLKRHDVGLCAAATGKVMVTVNSQTAYLNARTGKQDRFDAKQSKCPQMLTDEYAHAGDDGAPQTVTRVL